MLRMKLPMRPVSSTASGGKMTHRKKSIARETASALDFEPIVLDDRIREQVAADFVELRFAFRAVEIEFDDFADARAFHRRQTVMMNGIAHGDALRIEHALLRHYDDFRFHEKAAYERAVAAQGGKKVES